MTTEFYDKFTLGWELEATRHASVRGVHLADPRIAVGSDGSVRGEGLEYRVVPDIVNDPQNVVAALKLLTTNKELQTDFSCGYHVHVGLRHKSMEKKLRDWACWAVTLARATERTIFSAVPESRRYNEYCRQWGKMGDDAIKDLRFGRGKNDSGVRYAWLNVVEAFRQGGIRTIEFRLMGEHHNYVRLLAWTGFCVKFAAEAYRLMGDPSHFQRSASIIRNHAGILASVFEGKSTAAEKAALASGYAAIFDYAPKGKKWSAYAQRERENRQRSCSEAYALGTWNDGCLCMYCSTRREQAARRATAAIAAAAVPGFNAHWIADNTPAAPVVRRVPRHGVAVAE